MVFGAIKFHGIHTIHRLDLIAQLFGGLIGDIGNHDPGGAKGGEIIVHHGQALTGFGVGGQIGGDVVFHLHPADGHHAENQRKNIEQKEKIAFIHNERGNLFHSTLLLFLFLHVQMPPVGFPNAIILGSCPIFH